MMVGYISPARVFSVAGAKISDMAAVGHSTSGDVFTAADAAALCSGIDEYPLMAAMAKWGGDDSNLFALEVKLWDLALRLGYSDGWPSPAEVPLRPFAKLALAESIYPNVLRSQAFKYRYCGISKDAWPRTWLPRYQMILSIFEDEWCGVAYRKVAANQVGDRLIEHVA